MSARFEIEATVEVLDPDGTVMQTATGRVVIPLDSVPDSMQGDLFRSPDSTDSPDTLPPHESVHP